MATSMAPARAIEKYGRDFFNDGKPTFRNLREKDFRTRGGNTGRPWNDSDRHGAANEILALDDIALGGFQLAKDCARAGKKDLSELVSRTTGQGDRKGGRPVPPRA